MRRRFTTLDVFTSDRFAGNPLAVVLDGDGFDTSVMQTIAREFNLPETVFVRPPSDLSHDNSLRIFTPVTELPFAGHPTVGVAVLLGLAGGQGERELTLAEQVGPVRCRFRRIDAARGRASFEVPVLPEYIGAAAAPEALAAALSLTPDDLGCGDFVAGRWKAGNTFTFIPVRGLDAIGRAKPNLAHWAAFGESGPRGAFLFCKETAEPSHAFHARMYAPFMGIPEDPATGSAVAAFAGMIARFSSLTDGTHRFVVEQGYEMDRPSLMTLTLELQAGALAAVSIAGDAVVVSEGTIEA